jgi:hypothetical protein
MHHWLTRGCTCFAAVDLATAPAPTALRKNPEERPSVLEMVHHPWVELYRARRSMRQLNIMAAAPTSANSSFTTSQVAAAAAAAGAATAGIAGGIPGSSSAAPAGALSAHDHAHHSAVGAAAAALNAAKKNLKHTVTSKVLGVASPLQRADAKIAADKDSLLLHLSAASSPCLLQTPGSSNKLLKAAVNSSAMAAAAAAAKDAAIAASQQHQQQQLQQQLHQQSLPMQAPQQQPPPQQQYVPGAIVPLPTVAAPPVLIKGGSVKVDEQTMSFLFGSGRPAGMNLASQVSAKHASHATTAAAQAASMLQSAEKTNESDMLIHALY